MKMLLPKRNEEEWLEWENIDTSVDNTFLMSYSLYINQYGLFTT